MRKLAALTALTLLISAGCTGMVGDPDIEVAKIQLYADNLGALLSHECVQMYKEDGCSRYPNPNECDSMEISVKGDGRTVAVCKNKGQVTSQFEGGVADGLPILCQANEEFSCQRCVDVFGNTVLDNCSRGASLYRAREGGWNQLPSGSGWLGVPGDKPSTPSTPKDKTDPPKDKTDPPKDKTDPPKTDPPPKKNENKCDPVEARKKYAENINKILKAEGLNFTYSPDLTKDYNSSGGYWGYQNKDMCKYWLASKSKLTRCWNPLPGKCHCMNYGWGVKKTCRCARINVFALRATCLSIPTDCDYKSWVANIVMEYGVATKWLFSGTYKNGYYKGLPSNPNSPPPAPDKVKCLGSPLVLDLGDDGIKPTSVGSGVNFDIMGHGKMSTAWIKGNDALLVMDRNRNGIIDDGTELFGSATDIGGAPAADGFEALARLDSNGNGLVERGDLLFDELKLWRDRDGDGLSDKGELSDLRSAGIIGLEIHGSDSCGLRTDQHGNDLSLRASFIRADGRKGLMVDVLFGIGK